MNADEFMDSVDDAKERVHLRTENVYLKSELARERVRHQWMPIEHDTKFTADMEVGRWMGPKWVITRMEGDSDGWVYIQPNDFFTHYRMLNPPALLAPAPVATGEDSQ